MTDRVIQLVQDNSRVIPLNFSAPQSSEVPAKDHFSRRLHDLRISVTDRCNFRCVYCMPKSIFDKDYQFLPHKDLLSFEEIEQIARQFVALGVEKSALPAANPCFAKTSKF